VFLKDSTRKAEREAEGSESKYLGKIIVYR
jgi:hypothetical protein